MFEALGDVYSQEDLNQFFSIASPNIPKGTGPDLDLINGATAPNRPEDAGGESDLDFDMAYPIIYPQKITLFQVRTDSDIFLAFLDAIDGSFCDKNNGDRDPNEMCNTFDVTSVVSMSYGGNEQLFGTNFLKVCSSLHCHCHCHCQLQLPTPTPVPALRSTHSPLTYSLPQYSASATNS